MILFINACVRKESRTLRLAQQLIKTLDGEINEIRLEDIEFPKVDEEFINRRDALKKAGKYDDPLFSLGKDFANADTIVIAAPYYDLSFPAMLKQYFEQVNVVGITFKYTEDGIPVGLCKARRLYYVTTAGGSYVPEEFGFGYIKALSQGFYGIQEVRKIEAAGLDLVGADVSAIMRAAESTIDSIN
jgi:FMN-dependent NADH-azoreductase